MAATLKCGWCGLGLCGEPILRRFWLGSTHRPRVSDAVAAATVASICDGWSGVPSERRDEGSR